MIGQVADRLRKYGTPGLLGVIILTAFLLSFVHITNQGFANQYYAASVRSMLVSWHHFFFLSYDPAGFVTVDKPPLGFWIQTGFAYLIGFKGWVLILPQVLAFCGSVWLVYRFTVKSFGTAAGLLSALFMTLTPIAVAASRNNTIDSTLVFVLLLASGALFKSVDTGKVRWLYVAMLLIGVGFNIKMMQAFMVLPAFVIYYAAASRRAWSKKIVDALIGAVVLLAVSFSWAVIVDLVPADERPYIGSSTDNTVQQLIFGHNGARRWNAGARRVPQVPQQPGVGNAEQGSQQQGNRAGNGQGNGQAGGPVGPPNGPVNQPNGQVNGQPNGQVNQPNGQVNGPVGPPNGPANGQPNGTVGRPNGPANVQQNGNGEIGNPGLLRMFNTTLAGQISWLLPLVFVSLIAVFSRYRSLAMDRNHHPVWFWLTWLVTMLVFFSYAGLFHRYYLIMLAPAIAVLGGVGAVAMWREFIKGGLRGILFPAALLATGTYQLTLIWRAPNSRGWLTPSIGIFLGVACLLSLAFLQLSRNPTIKPIIMRWITSGLVAFSLVSLMLGPSFWSLTPALYGDSSGLPFAGPELRRAANPPPAKQVNTKLIAFLQANYKEGSFLVASASVSPVSPIIIETGLPAIAYGGFNGGDPILTVDQLEALIQQGKVKYFLIGNNNGAGGPQNRGRLDTWIQQHGKPVPQELWNDAIIPSRPQQPAGSVGQMQLYEVNL